jgi:hypothetical protein
MYELFGKHRQDLNEVRRLCLICHGLDLTGNQLFQASTYENSSESTEIVFENLVSGMLLSLAVAIRINIYQGNFQNQEQHCLADCGFYYHDDELICKSFTIKDVCDKIIHADSMSKATFPPEILKGAKPTIQLKGKQAQRTWTLDLSIELFTETVLNYIDKIENKMANL